MKAQQIIENEEPDAVKQIEKDMSASEWLRTESEEEPDDLFPADIIPASIIFKELDSFTQAYIVCALWSTTDESNARGGDPLDQNYGPVNIAQPALRKMARDCKKFQRENMDDIESGSLYTHEFSIYEFAGHNFWLSRSGAGTGFFDAQDAWDDAVCDRLQEAAEAFGEVYLSVGDDGQIYC